MAKKWKEYESSWEPIEGWDDLSSEDSIEPASAEAPISPSSKKPHRRKPKKTKRSSKPSNEYKPHFYPMNGLNYFCELLPGGITTAIEFARLAGIENERFKNLANLYDKLSYQQKAWIQLEDLCSQVGIQEAEFIGMLCRFAYESGFDVLILLSEVLRAAYSEEYRLAYLLNNPDDHKARQNYLKETGLI
jgi:hypothetical protein